jgi:DNA-binding transcriptional ArsR family regulator
VERRRNISESGELAALAHPVRLDLLNYLISAGPATASACARAVGDTPSNCSYHLRFLARYGLVEAGDSGDGREKPWRAMLTGFGVDRELADAGQARALDAIAVERDHRLVRSFLARRGQLDAEWDAAAGLNAYTLRLTPDELTDLEQRLDAVIRPYIAATRRDAPADAALVHLGVRGFPLEQP